ncbi:dienelactone hydrolase family protein [Roseovarius sp. THAF27]|uniref:dienelactone hydrolase family protein n=1 Tax=Roseovarius sp. THAF27 TaxID=2587850 RepID=UPI0012692813|nr:dienelactone hydrolase family protein [Roseovarius sp. THAF27]
MHRRSIIVASAVVVCLATHLANAQQAPGLHNSSKTFTDPDAITQADIVDPQEVERTWQAALVRVPTGLGRSQRTTFEDLAAQYGDGSRKFPVAIYMHGCSGIWRGTHLRVKFLADNGFLVIAPASFARTVYAQSCDPSRHEGSMFRDVIKMRKMDAGHAIELAKSLPYVDPENVLLIGLSQGGVTTAKHTVFNERRSVTARVIEGWTCNAGWYEYIGLDAPKDEPVLSLVGSKDPWYQNERNEGDCWEAMNKENGSISIVYDTGPLATRHELLEFKSVQKTTLEFLHKHMNLPLNAVQVQRILTDQGYDPGPIDGIWGQKSLAALNELRAERSLPPVADFEASSQELLKNLLRREN